MAEQIFYGLFLIAAVAGFWFVYGMFATKFQLWRKRRSTHKEIGRGLRELEPRNQSK
jgi:hypothetical protein